MVEKANRFERITSIKKLHATGQKMILSGYIPAQIDPYSAFADKSFIDLRIQLTPAEEVLNMGELAKLYREFANLVHVPNGRTEMLCSTIRDEKYLVIYCHCYSIEIGKQLYESLHNFFSQQFSKALACTCRLGHFFILKVLINKF